MSCRAEKGASRAVLERVEKQLRFELPDDYKQALLESDGFEGFIGDGDFVRLWPAAQILPGNRGYKHAVPDLVLLGTDGGGEGYALRKRRGRVEYVLIPLTGGSESECIRLAASFSGFIRKLGVGAFS